MDKIYLKNMEFFAFHGVMNDERINGQYFEIDVEMGLDLSHAAESDSIMDTVDYGQIYLTVKEETTKNRYNLVETLASKIIAAIFAKNPRVDEVCVAIRKPQAPIDGKLTGPEVVIRRARHAG
ncbi:MAG: dihydroneopterin aldolase [Clostridia bacterium]